MRNKSACIFAALLLVIVITTVAINSIYVKNTADHLISSLDALPKDVPTSSYQIKVIADYWDEQEKILSIALSDPELDLISSLFDELIIVAEEGNTEEYKKSMARLMRAIEDIRKLEEISLENIF